MARDVKANYRKDTWQGALNINTDGRNGVTNYAGHAWWHSIGLHVSLNDEPDRPVSIHLNAEDIETIKQLIEAHEQAKAEWESTRESRS